MIVNKVKYDNFENIFDKGTTSELTQLLRNNGVILFSDSDGNIWEIVKRKDLKPEDLIENLDTIYSVTSGQNIYIEDDIMEKHDSESEEVNISIEVDISKLTEIGRSLTFNETVNEMSENIIQ
jgi:hypothetical protein